MLMHLQEVSLNNYSIFLGDVFPQLNKTISSMLTSKIFVFVDENTQKYCLPYFKDKVDFDFVVIAIKSGEENKNIETCSSLWQELLQKGGDRKSLVINLSGGVLSDMGGFVASTFMRGISFINIPTTLLAMVDASVGGKTGVDADNVKNIIGLFSFPKAVFIDPYFLNTLDKKNLLSGYAEMLKHGAVADEKYLQKLLLIEDVSSLHHHEWSDNIFGSVNIKKDIVAADPNESGVRKILNFGHTVGHAIETASIKDNNAITHGHAVALGMIAEMYLSSKYFDFPLSDVSLFHQKVLSLYPVQDILSLSKQNIIDLMMYDKKNEQGEVKFSLLKNFGETVYDITVCENDISAALDYLFLL